MERVAEATGPGPTEIVALERELRERLRSCRLIGELGVDGDTFERAERVILPALRGGSERTIRRFSRSYPAVFAYYLVGVAARDGAGGELWPFVPFAHRKPTLGTVTGQSFASACRSLGLERFAEVVRRERARRYIAPILIHAMVPRPAAPRFLRLVLEYLDDGIDDPVEMVSRWRKWRDLDWDLPAPARRFVQVGGDLVVDYVRRVIDLVRLLDESPDADARFAGLPGYMAEELRLLSERSERRRRLLTAPRPRVEFDPWGAGGPEVVLPATQRADEWIIITDGERERRRAEALRDVHLPLKPARHWVVEGRRSGEVVSRLDVRTSPGGVLVFDAKSQEVVRNDPVTTPEVFLLFPRQTRLVGVRGSEELEVEKPLEVREECPELFGGWQAYQAVLVDLTGFSRVVASDGEDVLAFTCASARQRAELVGTATVGTMDSAGRLVYDRFPYFRLPDGADPRAWNVVLRCGPVTVACLVAELESPLPGLWSLPSASLQEPVAAVAELRVRGPLGSDLHEEFLVVSGLAVELPDGVAGPVDPLVLAVRADRGVVLAGDGVDDGWLVIPPGTDRARVTARAGSHSATFQIMAPRLVWSFATERPGGFSGDVAVLSADEFVESTPRLWVRVGQGGRRVRVVLAHGDEVLQQLDWKVTDERVGRASFELRSFDDTVRVHDVPVLSIWIEMADGPQARAVSIRKRYEFTDLTAIPDVEAGVLEVAFSEMPPMPDRRAAIWSLESPWADPQLHDLPDDADPTVGFVLDTGRLAPGQYLCQVFAGCHDPMFPIGDTSGLVRFEIPETGLTVEPADRVPGKIEVEAADPDNAARLVRQALAVVTTAVRAPEMVTIDPRVVDRAREALFARPALLYRALLADAEERLRRSLPRRVQFAVKLLQSAVDCPPEDDLSALEYQDLWELSPLLAAAADRKHGEVSRGRWSKRTGWLPSNRLPFPGKTYSPRFVESSRDAIEAFRAKVLLKPATLLGQGGFALAMADYLVRRPLSGRRSERVVAWRREHHRVIRPKVGRFPASVAEALEAFERTGDIELIFPRDLLAAGMQLVCFVGDTEAAEAALSEAAEFAPLLVQRQVVVALAHHLVHESLIDLGTTEE